MRAAYYTRPGPARDVIEFGDFDRPRPGAGDVLVKVRASGVNPSDIKSRTLMFERVKDLVPLIPHTDGAGIVESVGDNVESFSAGDRVWVALAQWRGSNGTCAEYVAVPENFVFPLPENTSFTEGACAGVPVLTAMHAVSLGPSMLEKNILITGGATAVGNYAIQFAKRYGARVLTTVGSEANAPTATQAGADETIFYKTEDVAARVADLTGGAGVDYLVDMDMSYYAPLYTKLVAQHGFIAVYGSNAPVADGFRAQEFFTRELTLKGFILWSVEDQRLNEMGHAASAMFVANELRHNIGATFPFSDAADAHDAVEYGRVPGNVVVEIP